MTWAAAPRRRSAPHSGSAATPPRSWSGPGSWRCAGAGDAAGAVGRSLDLAGRCGGAARSRRTGARSRPTRATASRASYATLVHQLRNESHTMKHIHVGAAMRSSAPATGRAAGARRRKLHRHDRELIGRRVTASASAKTSRARRWRRSRPAASRAVAEIAPGGERGAAAPELPPAGPSPPSRCDGVRGSDHAHR